MNTGLVSRSVPPQPDEFEISVIGPGRGESLIIHIGDNEWCIVDSCIARGGKEPVASEYLRSFKNDALNRVRLVVATHWHDDHIRGLSSIIRDVPGAQFCCSSAINTDNFLVLIEAAVMALQGQSGVDEFAAIYESLTERPRGGVPKELAAPMWAIENRVLLERSGSGRPFPVKITSLSPSDGTLKIALKRIGELIPKPGEPQLRITNLAPNLTSVALWIQAGPRRVLLGADLEHTGRAGEGWLAVLASHQDSEPSMIFKVAHHGSKNADCPEVWTQMLAPNPLAVVTPFTGGSGLPQESDIDRLSTRTLNLYCTSKGPGKPPSRGPLVDKTARRTLVERQVIDGQPGHVRLRWSATSAAAAPVIETFNGAFRVEHASAATPQ